MKQLFRNYNTIRIIILLTAFIFLLASCENKLEVIPSSEILSMPSLSADDFQTVFIDSGKLQLIMSSILMEKYDNSDTPYSEFKTGIRVLFYDGKTVPQASVNSEYAKYGETDKIWELRDKVTVINELNETLETELLFWNQDKDLIYTDRYVKITSQDQIIHGFGFESDSRMKVYKIKKVQATIYLDDEE